MSLNAEDLIPKIAKLIAVSRSKAESEASAKVDDIANMVNAVTDAGPTDAMQTIVDNVAAEIEAEVARLNGK